MSLFEYNMHSYYRDKNNTLKGRRDTIFAETDKEAREIAQRKAEKSGKFEKTIITTRKLK